MRKTKPKGKNVRNKAFQYAIYPNAEQAELLEKTFGCARAVYNMALYDSMEFCKAADISYVTPYARYKVKNPWLCEVDSLALANSHLALVGAYKRFYAQDEFKFSRKKIERAERLGKELTPYDLCGHPKFKSKKHTKKKYTTNCVNENIEVSENRIKLPKVGLVKIKQHRIPPAGYVLKSVTITKSPSGKYFATVLYEYAEAINPVEVSASIGLDFSMGGGYVDSNGSSPKPPRWYRDSEMKLAREQRKLSRMVRGSNNYEKQRLKVAAVHDKISRQRSDNLHKESKRLSETYDLIGVEDIDMRAMAQSLNFGKSVHDSGWGLFREFLEYKMAGRGKHYIVIGKTFASSKLCSTPGCSYKNAGLQLGDREWICPNCGVLHDRDINAAINIREEALRIHYEGMQTKSA